MAVKRKSSISDLTMVIKSDLIGVDSTDCFYNILVDNKLV